MILLYDGLVWNSHSLLRLYGMEEWDSLEINHYFPGRCPILSMVGHECL